MRSGVCICRTEHVCSAPWSSTPSSCGKGAPGLAGFVLGGFDVHRPRTGAQKQTCGLGGF
eukprot:821320-Rhodomonas_salina.1